MERALEELNVLLNKSPLSRSDIVSILAQIRILLESHNLQSKYQALNLYCNWTFHSKISGSIVCYKILEQLTDILLRYDAGEPELIARVTDVLLIPELRDEFIKFCNHFKLPSIHFSEQNNWKGIFGLIIYNLIDRPLEFPNIENLLKKRKLSKSDQKVKSIYDTIQNKAKGTDLAVKRFSFSTYDWPDMKDEAILHKNTLVWNLEPNRENVRIISPLIFMGKLLIFK